MKIAVVTGASTGIGRAVALELGKNGYEVYLVARRPDELVKTQQQITAAGGIAQVFPADLSSMTSINQLLIAIKAKTKYIDLIANIAGIWHGDVAVFAGVDFEKFDQQVIIDTFNVGTIAPALLVQGLLPLMSEGGKIINLSGTFENGGKGWLPYFVSKRSIEDFTIGLSQELEDRGIQVNCISPSDTATDAYARFFPQYIEDAVQPVEIANMLVELANPSSKITGKVFVIKKGQKPRDSFHY